MNFNRKSVVLLNPPGKKEFLRDYFCSKVSKASYYNQPVDFIFLSGILSGDFNVSIMDCIAERLTDRSALIKLCQVKPDIIIFLTGAVSMGSDFLFLEKVKRKTRSFMVGIGDIFLDYSRKILMSPGIWRLTIFQ